MNRPREANVLLGALLERLGTTQAQALLARLDQWLTRDGEKVHTQEHGFDRDQAPGAHASYDRRRHEGNELERQTLMGGVSHAEGRQS
jgi:hypothetical protein